MRPREIALRALILAGLLHAGLLHVATASHAQEDPLLTWRFYEDELAVESALLARFENPFPTQDLVLRDVTIVDLPEGRLLPRHAVTVRAGRIVWTGAVEELAVPQGSAVIDGNGRYLLPGLIDMHTHVLVTSAHYLTLLGTGVTTIREMDGFPWILARKHQAAAGHLLAPSMFVTGQILNRNDFGGYARAVRTPEDARRAVREQHAAGYDAIKIHNSLSIEIFDAICDEARRAGLDVVGHNPQPVPVAHAVQHMRTAEHFKGYIDDETLTLSRADWLTPTLGADIYLTPTMHTYREHLRGDDALAILDGPEGKLIHPRLQAQWRRAAAEPVTDLTKLRQNILPMSQQIFTRFLPHRVRWLAGTDSGSYDFMVPGPALLDEMEAMERLGLPALEVLAAATTNAAAAMRWEDRIGGIAPGMQADLLLLRENPLETVRHLRSLEALVLRGMWIPDAAALRNAPRTVWAKAEISAQPPSPAAITAHLEARRALAARGWMYNHFQLDELKQLIAGFGHLDLAAQVDSLR